MICNKDCFVCPYPDCINDEMDAADRRESRARDKLLGVPRREKCSADDAMQPKSTAGGRWPTTAPTPPRSRPADVGTHESRRSTGPIT